MPGRGVTQFLHAGANCFDQGTPNVIRVKARSLCQRINASLIVSPDAHVESSRQRFFVATSIIDQRLGGYPWVDARRFSRGCLFPFPGFFLVH
jgi:hypothetical protein